MRCLLVRHLPSWLSKEEKESLFGHFGAQEVVVMPNKGKMVELFTVCKQSTVNDNKSYWLLCRETVFLLHFTNMKMPKW